MTKEDAMDYLARCADGSDPEYDAAVALAVSALRAQVEAERNEPLTLAELRKMDGEPVYVECLFNKNLSSYVIIDRSKIGIFTKSFFADFDYYGYDWLAYRHKPPEPVTT